MNVPKVCVLMSTYNGARYLREQLESILNQEKVDIVIYVRDDGSTDQTWGILNEYKKNFPNQIFLLKGDNIGWRYSFFEVMKIANGYKYYAFADQDDVWMPLKIKRAVEFLKKAEKENKVSLYAGNVWITDAELNIQKSFCPIGVNMLDRSIEEVTIQCGLPGGLTYVFTNEAREKTLKLYPGGVYGHDAWLLLTCLYLGKIIYDDEPMVYYRQHGLNAIGAERNFLNRMKGRFYKVFQNQDKTHDQMAEMLIAAFDEIKHDSDNYAFLKKMKEYNLSFFNRIKFMLSKNVKSMTLEQTVVLYMKIFLGKF